MITIGGTPVHRAELHAKYHGRWTLEIAYAAEEAPSGLVSVAWGAATFTGTVDPKHVGVFNGEAIAKIVGGFGWSQQLPAAWYQSDNPGLQGRTIALQAAEQAGETLYGATGTTVPA